MPPGISEPEMDAWSRATNSITHRVQPGHFWRDGAVLDLAGNCGKSPRVSSGPGCSVGGRAAQGGLRVSHLYITRAACRPVSGSLINEALDWP